MHNVLIDIDDTMADLSSVLLARVNEHLDVPLRYEELTLEHRERGSGNYQDLVNEVLRDPANLEVVPYPGALEAVRKLHAAGHRVHIVSARKEHWHQATVDWLRQYGFAEFVQEIHPRKSDRRGVEFKRDVARRLRAEAAFDDTLNVAVALSEVCPRAYLIDRPWNRAPVPDERRIQRCADLLSAARHFLGN